MSSLNLDNGWIDSHTHTHTHTHTDRQSRIQYLPIGLDEPVGDKKFITNPFKDHGILGGPMVMMLDLQPINIV